jgi:electron transfer DM13
MTGKIRIAAALAAVTLALGLQVYAQDSMNHDGMKHEGQAKTLETGTFHGKVHSTSGRATIYKEEDGKLILRLTNFKTSNGPDVHVILVAAKDADDDANFLKSDTQRVELGKLKGNEGDQNYEVPAGTDLSKFQTVSIYCERFNANFGAAPLEKF